MLPNRSLLEAMKMVSAQELKVFIIPGRVTIKMEKKGDKLSYYENLHS